MRTLPILALLAVLPAATPAQQFFARELPGPVVWSEAAIPFDADEDGDLDVLIMNAQGWEVPGDFDAPNALPLPPTLLINTGTDVDGYPIWVDESTARLPAGLVLHGGSAAVGDFDGDGHEDLALAAAFGAQQRLLIKDPATGAFLDESFRLPVLVLNSMHVATGDLDDDGDLDLDILVDGKSPTTQLYLNDGSGVFTLDLVTVPSSAQSVSKQTYEMDYADLDGDSDFDAMLMNYGFGWRDGALENLLVPSGALAFLDGAAAINAIAAPNSHDENDFAFLDADDDGDLDVLVATLGSSQFDPPSPEKLWINAGSFGDGFLTDAPGAFDVGVDATLDLAVADFSGDGRYDVISVQGEFTPFVNKFHRNTGTVDTRAPDILKVTPGGTIRRDDALDGLTIRAVICDAVVDDGFSFVSAEAIVDTDKGGETTHARLPMPHVGGYVHRAAFTPVPTTAGLVGMDLSWSVETSDPLGQLAVSPVETARVCGTESYGTAGPLPGLALTADGDPVAEHVFGVSVSGGSPGEPGLLLAGFARAGQPLLGGTLLIDLTRARLFNLPLDGSGSASVQVTLDAGLIGFGAVLQYASLDAGQPQGLALSNGLEFVVCAD